MVENILNTQISIGEKVSSLINGEQPVLNAYQNRNHPDSPDAYKLFLIAQSHMKSLDVEHLEKALNYFQQAIDVAPNYAIAHTGMASAIMLLYQYKHTSLPEASYQAMEALNKAFTIEPNLAEAFAVRGLLETYNQKYDLAEADFKKAIALNPGLRFARHNYSGLIKRQIRILLITTC